MDPYLRIMVSLASIAWMVLLVVVSLDSIHT